MIRAPIALGIVTVMLAACGERHEAAPSPETAENAAPDALGQPATPDLAACPEAEPFEFRQRTAPIPVPAAFEGIAASSMDHLAFTTAQGSTVCVDATWLEEIEGEELSGDGRFASFDWVGYEAFGHVVVDRAGRGQVIDTGNRPHLSPSGKRLASVDLGQAEFGSLNAFAVWDVAPTGLRPVAEISEGFPSGDWRIEGWQGESCVRLSVVPLERQPEDFRDMDTAPRDPWHAAEAGSWRPVPGSCPRE